MKMTFEMFEGGFGFVGNDYHRSALILKFRDRCNIKAWKPILSDKIKEQLKQYGIIGNDSISLLYLTIVLNEASSNGVHNAVADDESKKSYTAAELRDYIMNNLQAKFREDGNERYWKIRKKHPTVDHCFYDVIKPDEFNKYLKMVGIKYNKHKNSVTYEGAAPVNNMNFDLQHSTPSNSSENVSKEISNEFLPGKKSEQKTGGQPHEQPLPNHVHHRHSNHGQQPQLTLSNLSIDQKKSSGQGTLKRLRSRTEKEKSPPQEMIRKEEESRHEVDDEADDEELDEEDMEYDEDEEEGEGVVGVEDEEMREEYSESPTDKKSSTPEVVDLDSDDDETAVSPAKKPMPRDILMTYKCTTIHFEDMKGLFFDEMVNDTIVDLYLSMMKDEIVKPPIRDVTHVFSCFFFKRLTEGMTPQMNYKPGDKPAHFRFSSVERNYTVLSKWTRKVDLFKMDYVVVPVVDDLHWYLIIIVKPHKCIVPANGGMVDNVKARRKGYTGKGPVTYAIMLDSLFDAGDQKRQTAIDIIRDYLELEYKNKKGGSNDGNVFDRTRIGLLRPKALPQQSNFLDCGFFLMKYAETFLSNPPSDDKLRKGILWRDWYVGFEISVRYMRELVARAIQRKTDKKVWKDYKIFEKSRRDEWDPARKQKEALHIARCRRYPSEEPRPNGQRRVRHHSEPSSLTTPMTSHFH
ncbi:ulp-2 [Pristionchus pacificus]|nr:ulp-2 [Pristionchus pacificus]